MLEAAAPMMSLGQLANYLSLTVSQEMKTQSLLSITTDSRSISQGDVFVALQGEQFDGHDFVEKALERGAIAAIVREDWSNHKVPQKALLRVKDTLLALGQIAKAWRHEINPFVIALTGSNGKTTIKEMMAGVLRRHVERLGFAGDTVLATEGNLNNAIGVPLTLLRLRAHHRFAIVEMGMNHPGEIAYLSELAQPDVALINTVQRAHIGLLGSIEAIAHAKSEIFQGLAREGVAIYPTHLTTSPILSEHARGHKSLSFGVNGSAQINGSIDGQTLSVSGMGDSYSVSLQVPGRHNLENALAVAAACSAAGVANEDIIQGLEGFTGVAGRLQSQFSALGALIIDDTYNANPDSVFAAINVLSERRGRRILVLGDLGELGEFAQILHKEVGSKAKEAGIDNLFTLGELTRHADQAFGQGAHHYDSAEEIINSLKPQLNQDTTVLVKGSRFMKMERVVEGLMQ